jgi:hypothetical protein
MGSLVSIARQRAVMTTIADAIVATAVGRSLRVAVGSTCLTDADFAEHLTQALIARGRPCRCLPPAAVTAPATDAPPQCHVGGPSVAVIVGGAPGPAEADLCRIDIRLQGSESVALSNGSAPHLRSTPQCCAAGGDSVRPDIVVDYLGPDGPTIRHLATTLTLEHRALVPVIAVDQF